MSVAPSFLQRPRRVLPSSRRRAAALAAGVLAAVLPWASPAKADETRVQLGAYAGYQFGGNVEAGGGAQRISADIQDAPSVGATLDVWLHSGAYLELAYSYQDTDVILRSPESGSRQYAMSVQHFTLGGVLQYAVPGAERLRPIFGATIGAARYGADDESYSYEDWYLSFILEGGLALRLIDNLGLRFRGRLLTTFLATNSAIFCGDQVGCAVSFSGLGLFQGDVSGGAYLAF